jgi:hypothetical protein
LQASVIPAGFDEWFNDYCAGKEVCEPSEIESRNGDGKDD